MAKIVRISPKRAGKIHFVGIGGIGMSGIAELLHTSGYTVQGSDTQESNYNIERLKSLGLTIFYGHKAENTRDASLLVTSSAIDLNHNVEVEAARKNSTPIIARAQMLQEIMRLKSCIAVAGTHGKTTTTCLIATLLSTLELDPTVINGGIMNSHNTNALLGSSKWMVVEADESDGSFLQLFADIVIITNIEMEHTDYYDSDTKLLASFQQFASSIPFYGLCILCSDDPNATKIAHKILDRRIITYGFNQSADIRACDISINNGVMQFSIEISHQALKRIKPSIKLDPPQPLIRDIRLPTLYGEHNVLNALAAICVAIELDIPIPSIIQGFKHFKGVKRRFSILHAPNKVLPNHVDEPQMHAPGPQYPSLFDTISIIDDYAHHPSEIISVFNTLIMRNASLAPYMSRHNNYVFEVRSIAVFQPHRYTRLAHGLDDFAVALRYFDASYVIPVYTAGEMPINGVGSNKLVQTIGDKALETNTQEELFGALIANIRAFDNIVFMGAGDITIWAKEFNMHIQTIRADPENIKIENFHRA